MNKFLIIILSTSFLINLTIALIACREESRFEDPDSKDYLALADNLAAFNGYTKGKEPEIFRAPGYPCFIAPFRYLLPNTVFPIILFQCVISTATIYLLWNLVLTLTGNNIRIAKFAIIIQTLSLSSIVFTNKILSETLFTFLMLLFFLFIEKTINAFSYYFKSENYSLKNIYLQALITGIAGGMLVFVRAIFLPFLPLFLIYIYYRLQKIRYRDYIPTPGFKKYIIPTKKILFIILLILIPFTIIIGGWSIRNSATAGYRGFSSVGSINIYRYYACLLMSKNNNISFSEQQRICDANLNKAGNQVKKAEYSVKHGLPIILNEPFKYFILHLKTDFNNLFPAVGDFYGLVGFKIGGKGTLSIIHSKGIIAGVRHYFSGNWGLFILAIPLILLLLIKYILVAIGVIEKIFCKINVTYYLYTLLILYMLIIPGAVSHPRFRVPVEPLLSMFFGIGFYFILNKKGKKGTVK